jgi:hypothetical protein
MLALTGKTESCEGDEIAEHVARRVQGVGDECRRAIGDAGPGFPARQSDITGEADERDALHRRSQSSDRPTSLVKRTCDGDDQPISTGW